MIRRVTLVAGLLSILFCVSACAPGTATSSSLRNPFLRGGGGLSLDRLSAGSPTYWGRALIERGGIFYGVALSFQIRGDGSTAYLSQFRLLRVVQITGLKSAVTLVSAPTTLGIATSYSASSNAVSIQNTAQRLAQIRLSFTSSTYFLNWQPATVIVSDDFRTLAGGDGSFFFIAQKAESLPTSSSLDLSWTWFMQSVDFGGAFTSKGSAIFRPAGIGGLGNAAFRIEREGLDLLGGEYALLDAQTGVFTFSLDPQPNLTDSPRASGTMDGVFLLSPDAQLILGYDHLHALSFIGGR